MIGVVFNNGIEITFSSNEVYNNILESCDYGIWGGYSYKTILKGNIFKNNNHGIAIEHGNQNRIIGNRFENDKIGIQLWERNEQPDDWGFPQNRDVDSKNYNISYNLFTNCSNPLRIKSSKNLLIDDNLNDLMSDFPNDFIDNFDFNDTKGDLEDLGNVIGAELSGGAAAAGRRHVGGSLPQNRRAASTG